MCDPLTIAASAAVIGTGVSIYGQVKAGKAAKKAADAEAASVERQARFKEGEIRDAHDRFMGRTATQVAKSGRAMGGSALDVIADNAIEAEVQIAAVRAGATDQATATRTAGKNARSQAYWNAAATGINGVSSVLSMANSWGGSAPNTTTAASTAWTSTGRSPGTV